MRRTLSGFLFPLLAMATACQQGGDAGASGVLEVKHASASAGIEARYSEGGQTVVLRASPGGQPAKSDLLDGAARSMTELAQQVISRSPAARPPVSQLFGEEAQ